MYFKGQNIILKSTLTYVCKSGLLKSVVAIARNSAAKPI